MDGKSSYIDSLTALRGVAALWVVVFHFDAFLDRLVAPAATGLVSRGYLWVDFFFVLSGFIICHVYGDRFTARPLRKSFWPYLSARFSRIYPLHLFSLGLALAFWVVTRAAVPQLEGSPLFALFTPETLPQNVALLHAMGTTDGLSWNVPSWSIAAEWWTYLIAVLIFPLLNVGRGWRTWGAIAACLLALVALERLHPSGTLDVTWDLGVLRCVLGFTMGVSAYQLYRARWGHRVLQGDLAFAATAVAILGLLHRTPADALLVPLFALLVLAAAHNRGRARGWLNTRPMRHLGDISYSVYMVQAFWLSIFWTGFALHTGRMGIGDFGYPLPVRLLLLVALLGAVVATGGLTYRFVEIPARDWLRSRSGRIPARAPLVHVPIADAGLQGVATAQPAGGDTGVER